jgi:hypothetical protein
MSEVRYAAWTTGAKLGIKRTEVKKINGLDWIFAFNAADEMVCAAPSDEFHLKVLEKRAPQEPNVPLQFMDLVRVDAGDSLDELEKVSDPYAEILTKAKNDKCGIVLPEPSVPHKDGVFVEKSGEQTWTYTYKNGSLTKSEVHDPALPDGGHMVFDEEPILVETKFAKLLGLREEDLHSDIGLV